MKLYKLSITIVLLVFSILGYSQIGDTNNVVPKWKFGIFCTPSIGMTSIYNGVAFPFLAGGVRASKYISPKMDMRFGLRYYQTEAIRSNGGSFSSFSSNKLIIAESTIQYFDIPIELVFHQKEQQKISPYLASGFSVCLPFHEKGRREITSGLYEFKSERFEINGGFKPRIYYTMAMGNEVQIYQRLKMFMELEFGVCLNQDFQLYHHMANFGSNIGFCF